MEKTKGRRILDDIKLSQAGKGLYSPERQESLNLIRKLLIPAIVLSLLITPDKAEAKAKTGQAEVTQTQTQTQSKTPGKALIIGQNHYDIEQTLRALPELAKAGAKIFAVELPEDYTQPILEYLRSPRTHEDRIQLTNATWIRTELDPTVVEFRRKLKESMLLDITGQKSEVKTQEIIKDTLARTAKTPNQWRGSAKNALHMIEKAYDANMEIACIDQNSIKLTTRLGNNDIVTDMAYTERNGIMAGNLAKLTQRGHVIGAVGAGHTGVGNGKSVEAQARKIGIKCVSIDTEIPTYSIRKLPTEYLASSDECARFASEIIKSFKKLTKTEVVPSLSGL